MTEYEGTERRKTNGDLAKLVTEAGAKLSALEDARTEMKGLRESVLVLAEAIALAPTAEEVEAAERRARLQIMSAVSAALLVILVLGFGLVRGQALQRQGIRCTVLQQYEHRIVNQASHDEVFRRFNLPIPPHRPLPPEPTEAQLAKACAPFLPKPLR